jgi:hypothetical protein
MGQIFNPNSGNGRLVLYSLLTDSGVFRPQSSTTEIFVRAIAGGGGGGAGRFGGGDGAAGAGTGGQGGSWAELRITTIAASYVYACGIAGTGQPASTGSATNGGNTTFGGIITCLGGLAGASVPASDAVGLSLISVQLNPASLAGQTATGGDVNVTGNAPAPGYATNALIDAGAGLLAFSTSTGDGAVSIGGIGGNSPLGAGGAGGSSFTNSQGQNATGFGSGGGGSCSNDIPQFAGGNGRPGCIQIWEYS